MVLVRLIYASAVTDAFDCEGLKQIIDRAAANNAELGVTGVLGFSQSYFLQCLEGSRSSVNTIYRNILSDNRHQNIQILSYEEIDEREFSSWGMAYIGEVQINRHINLKYSDSSEFTPHQMSGLSAHRMLKELAQSIPVLGG
jgi:hypothetical protein